MSNLPFLKKGECGMKLLLCDCCSHKMTDVVFSQMGKSLNVVLRRLKSLLQIANMLVLKKDYLTGLKPLERRQQIIKKSTIAGWDLFVTEVDRFLNERLVF